jgi:hypothetical protein
VKRGVLLNGGTIAISSRSTILAVSVQVILRLLLALSVPTDLKIISPGS